LALIDAHLGEKEKAIRESRTACDILPVSRDAVGGPPLISNLARVYALTGEKDLALERLGIVSKIPFGVDKIGGASQIWDYLLRILLGKTRV